MASRVLTTFQMSPVWTQIRHFHGTKALSLFYEPERSGYPVKYDRPPPKPTLLGRVTGGYQMLIEESKRWIDEQRAKMDFNFAADYPPQVHLWGFKKDPAALDNWIITCDSDYDEGYSTCSLELSPDGTGIFSGRLDTKIPKDGKVQFAGFCNMKLVNKRKSFYRTDMYNFYPYTHLVLRIRGDGRPYLLNIYCRGYYDITWNDVYHYPLYTTGGPFWQVVKIPFSKFVFSSKGVIQDSQTHIHPEKVTSFGITIADKVTGPFKLEIDSIGLELDRNHYEQFAYESYRIDGILM